MRSFRFVVVAFALFCLIGGSATAVVFHQAVVHADRITVERLSAADAAEFLIDLEASRQRREGRYVDVGGPAHGRPYALTRDGGRSVLISGGSGQVRYLLHADGSLSTLP